MKISFVGSGNVAWHLSQAFEEAGHWICEVYSRNIANARSLATLLYDTDVQETLNFSDSPAELIILAVSDDALDEVFAQIVFPENCAVINTSGTKSLAELQRLVNIYSDLPLPTGILYPLQTLTKETEVDYSELPFCIESHHESLEKSLFQLAGGISKNVNKLNSYDRYIFHIGAVFASNFTNHLLSIAYDIVTREGLSFELLKPLVRATIEKALVSEDPSSGQTGPARRGDIDIITKHLEYLTETEDDWRQVYELMTAKIRSKHMT